MSAENYINEGLLELYVAGVLTEAENERISKLATNDPELLKEVKAIEAAYIVISEAVAPANLSSDSYQEILSKIRKDNTNDVIPLHTTKKTTIGWLGYIGWAAALFLAFGIWGILNNKKELEYQITSQEAKNRILEEQITEARADLESANELVSIFRAKGIKIIPLDGQANFENTYAKAIWYEEDQKVYIDAAGLPDPPPGKVYQVWSLKLEPLTPTSLGLLKNFTSDDNKVFTLNNPNESEAFGITLEPAGGSETPTMEKLYTLGAVGS